MTDFIPFPSPPGNTGNPKQVHQDYFQVGQQIKVKTMAQVSGDTNGSPPNPSEELTAEASIMNPHTPDLRPIYLNLYAITTNPDQWGVTTYPRWAETGTTGTNDNANNNGRLVFIDNGGFQDAANGGISRYIISNAGGITNFGSTWAAATGVGEAQDQQGVTGDPEVGADAVKGYNINSFSTMQADYVRDYRTETRAVDDAVMGGNGDGTDVDDWTDPTIDDTNWLPTVFTSDGSTTGTKGDSLDAWREAMSRLDDHASANGLTNIQKIHQWDWPACYAYSSDKSNPEAEPEWDGGYDRLSAAVDFQATTGSLRWAKPGYNPDTGFYQPFDRGFWDYEVYGFIGDPNDPVTTPGLGFNGLTWGVSGNTYQEFDDRTIAAEQIKAAYPDVPFLFEASPMQSTGTGEAKVFHQYGTTWDLDNLELSGMPDQRYTAAAHWGFFPSYYTTEEYSADATANGWSSNGGRWIDNIWWDPSIHEQHIIFDAGYLVRTLSNAPQYTFDKLKSFMILAWQHGFVVGVSSLTRSGGLTPEQNLDICQFVTDLNTFTSSNGVDMSNATDPVTGDRIVRYTNPAAEKSIPDLPSTLPAGITTFGMTSGAYATATDPQGRYSPMSWITFTAAQFTTAGLTPPSAGVGNVIDTQEAADTYEDFVVDVALTSLAQFHQTGNPICVDIEDIGVDAAIGRQDLMRAAREIDAAEGIPNAYDGVAQWNLGFYSDSSLSYTASGGGAGTDWSVAGPLVKQMLINIRRRIQAVYPTSPVGFYQVGPACWYTGFWSGCMETDRGTVNNPDYRTGNVWQQNLKQQTALDSNYYGWQLLDATDFSFYAYYLMSDNREYLPFTLNPNLADTSAAKREKLSTFFYWLLKYFGPSTANWERFGKKFMIGCSMENEWPNNTDRSGANNIWTEYLLANTTQFPLSYDPWDTTGYLNYADVTGASITQLTGIPELPDLVYMPKQQAQDLFKWLMSDTDDTKPDTGWQRLPFEARLNPIDIDGNAVGALPDSMRDFKFAVWDGIYTGGTYSTGGANNVGSRYEAFGLPSATATSSGKFAMALYLRPETFSQWVADGSVDTQAGFYGALQTYADNEVNEWIIPMFLNRGDNYSYSS